MKASRTKILAQKVEYQITTSTACSTWQPGDNSFSRTRYTSVVEPTLARFNLRSNWRTFQNQTVPDIITSMLA
nr:contractile injection system protein, VgrG/Pvc8 family [Pseudomonas sp. MF7453]